MNELCAIHVLSNPSNLEIGALVEVSEHRGFALKRMTG